jgi:hypothetical protein
MAMVEFADIDAALRMKRRLAGEPEPDLDLNRGLIGRSSRIDIPLRDRHVLRKAAEQLRVLGERLDVITRRSELDETAALLMAKGEIFRVKKAITEAHGNTNKNGTFRGA